MAQVNRYSFPDRQAAKAASRAKDAASLNGGLVSRAELRAVNGVFSPLDLSRASIRRRGSLAR